MNDDEIARHLEQALKSGELRQAESFGKPLDEDAGYLATPDGLRMPFKILKNAGFVPPEVELMHEAAELREALRCDPPADKARELRAQLTALELRIAMRLERLAKG